MDKDKEKQVKEVVTDTTVGSFAKHASHLKDIFPDYFKDEVGDPSEAEEDPKQAAENDGGDGVGDVDEQLDDKGDVSGDHDESEPLESNKVTSDGKVTFDDDGDDWIRKGFDDLREGLKDLRKPTAEAKKEDAQVEPPVDLSSLTEDEIDQIDLYRYAAEKDPKYQGIDKKLTDWALKAKAYVDAAGDSFDAEYDSGWQALLKKKPEIPAKDLRKFSTLRDVDGYLVERTKPLEEKIRDYENKIKQLESKPAVEAELDVYRAEFQKVVGDDLSKFEQVQYNEVLDQGAAFAREYVNLVEGVVAYDPNSELHTAIGKFVAHQAQEYKAKGGKATVRDGKTFVTPDEYYQLQQSGRGWQDKWTFSKRDVVKMLANKTSQVAKSKVQKEIERLRDLGIDVNLTKGKGQSAVLEKTGGTTKSSSKSKVDIGPGAGSGVGSGDSATFADIVGNPMLKGLMG